MVTHGNAKTGTYPVEKSGDRTSAPAEHKQRSKSSAVEKRKGNGVGPDYLLSLTSVEEVSAHKCVQKF